MEEEDYVPVYVRKNREPYSGLVLESIFKYLRRGIVIIVALGMLLMFAPFLF